MNRQLAWLLVLLFSASAFAAGPGAVRKRVESSMLVTGTIDIAPDGSVGGYGLDQADKLPPAVIELLGKNVPTWRFIPITANGKAVAVHAKMSLGIVARKLDKDRFMVMVRGAGFDAGNVDPQETITGGEMDLPRYPAAALSRGIRGTAYLLLRIGRHGTVEDVVAEQVNLRNIGSEQQMDEGRRLLASAAIRAARSWTFNPPTRGEAADAEFWTVRVPVAFEFEGARQPQYGEWQAYVPGPRQASPWQLQDLDAAFSPDALLAGGVYQAGTGPRLLTPLGKG